jgi:preprotein translocase subunit YajC
MLQLLVIVIALFGFWAIVMRPARVQQRQVAQLQVELEVGDEVIISAGIFGTVVAIDDERVQLAIAPSTVITVARQVVVRRAPEARDDAAGQAETPTDRTTEDD